MLKGDFFMFTKVLKLKRLSVNQLCMVSVLTAVTAVLSIISGYLRVGSFGKISISFISVYISAAAFGPFIGGLVGALADIISYAANPIGVYLWPLAFIEYAYGFVFGLFFYRASSGVKVGYVKIAFCVLLQFVANITLKTFILMKFGYAPLNYTAAAIIRIPSCLIAAILQFTIILAMEKALPTFLKIITKNKM